MQWNQKDGLHALKGEEFDYIVYRHEFGVVANRRRDAMEWTLYLGQSIKYAKKACESYEQVWRAENVEKV